MRTSGGGEGYENLDTCGQGVGVKNGRKFEDVLYHYGR